ncbi:TIGR03085 family protein [Brachybacterium ginsengisoli]|uniref:TIGR03085 family protein n=1 Tax=Brachybacterium ginsengisoli TaxID=1331682 RepID=A0A291GXH3_9MICO|nr:TIGR03085 family metal-binding protein [Brachybacterium ginsengisoli]ATG54878.1 TIGR03085 family protein [Brachybacterium ginsengisoli]
MAPSTGHDERAELADTFLALGPQAETILPGWDAADLLDHLLVREGHPHLVAGSSLPGPIGRRAARARQALRDRPWEQQVDALRAGPGRLSPAGTADRLSGQGELLIHHEDLRRAQDGWEPRRLSVEATADAWRSLGLMAPLVVRVQADVTLISPLGGRRLRSRRGAGSLRIHGEPLELLLWASGRDRVARVRVHGDEGGMRALGESRRGL